MSLSGLLFCTTLLSMLVPHKGEAAPRKKTAFKPSVSLSVGPAFLFGEKTNSSSRAFSISNMGFSISIGSYRGTGITLGQRGGNYPSPNIPEGYQSIGGILKTPSNDEYNFFRGRYALMTYDWQLFRKINFFLRPGVGIASTSEKTALFTPHSSSGGTWFISEPTHDVSFIESTTSGFAAQLGAIGAIPTSPKDKCRLWLGATIWTMPGVRERFYGIDVQLGAAFFFRSGRR